MNSLGVTCLPIVVQLPSLDFCPRIFDRQELIDIQADEAGRGRVARQDPDANCNWCLVSPWDTPMDAVAVEYWLTIGLGLGERGFLPVNG